ncbi:MAG: hypothetical protein GY951_15135, partial [Psychromonas sp.]|nr:hypothetical protein [Psychromonas sp.]
MQHKLIKSLLASAIALSISPTLNAETFIRVNQLGYTQDREKVVVVMSDKSLQQADY